MNNFWSNVMAGSVGAVVSAIVTTALGQLGPLGSRLVFPQDTVITIAGDCPPGWRRYDAASGRYVVAADGKHLEAGTTGDTASASIEYGEIEVPSAGESDLVSSNRRHPSPSRRYQSPPLHPADSPSSYVVLSMCQRR